MGRTRPTGRTVLERCCRGCRAHAGEVQ
jgi:hypothetical protein